MRQFLKWSQLDRHICWHIMHVRHAVLFPDVACVPTLGAAPLAQAQRLPWSRVNT